MRSGNPSQWVWQHGARYLSASGPQHGVAPAPAVVQEEVREIARLYGPRGEIVSIAYTGSPQPIGFPIGHLTADRPED